MDGLPKILALNKEKSSYNTINFFTHTKRNLSNEKLFSQQRKNIITAKIFSQPKKSSYNDRKILTTRKNLLQQKETLTRLKEETGKKFLSKKHSHGKRKILTTTKKVPTTRILSTKPSTLLKTATKKQNKKIRGLERQSLLCKQSPWMNR